MPAKTEVQGKTAATDPSLVSSRWPGSALAALRKVERDGNYVCIDDVEETRKKVARW
jgi:hypothetical protein